MGRQEGQVDRQDHDGIRAAGDDVGPCIAEAGVEAARSLAQGPCAEVGRAGEDLAVGAHDQDVGESIGGKGGHHGPCQEPLDEVLPLLGIELLAEPGLGALERADRDDRRDPGSGHRAAGRRRANSSTSCASRARPACVAHDGVDDECPQPERGDRRLERGVERVEHEGVDEAARTCAATPRALDS